MVRRSKAKHRGSGAPRRTLSVFPKRKKDALTLRHRLKNHA
jgi:hypothetical protein